MAARGVGHGVDVRGVVWPCGLDFRRVGRTGVEADRI